MRGRLGDAFSGELVAPGIQYSDNVARHTWCADQPVTLKLRGPWATGPSPGPRGQHVIVRGISIHC